jgi:hypothetical protein
MISCGTKSFILHPFLPIWAFYTPIYKDAESGKIIAIIFGLRRDEVLFHEDLVVSKLFVGCVRLNRLKFEYCPHGEGDIVFPAVIQELQHLIVWELEWPSICGIFKFRNLITQEFLTPDRIRVSFAKGPLRGTEVDVLLSEIDQGTLVEERYRIALPNWRVLRGLVPKIWAHRLDRVWDEDLRVGMCHGGWPELPRSSNGGPTESGA